MWCNRWKSEAALWTKKWLNHWWKKKSRCVFGLRQRGGPKQTWSDPTSDNLFFFFSFFNFAALLKVKPTSNCSSPSARETDGFKADEAPPAWWVNFNHQSWAGGVHYVHEVICILIPFIHLCGYFFFFHHRKFTAHSSTECLKTVMRARDAFRSCWCCTAMLWSVTFLFLTPKPVTVAFIVSWHFLSIWQ